MFAVKKNLYFARIIGTPKWLLVGREGDSGEFMIVTDSDTRTNVCALEI
jgi:hypothetical protein